MHWQNLVHLESGSSPVNLSLDWGPTLTKLTFDWWNNMKLTIRYNKYHNIISHFSFIIKLLYSTSLWLEYFFFFLCSSFSHHWYREGGRERETDWNIYWNLLLKNLRSYCDTEKQVDLVDNCKNVDQVDSTSTWTLDEFSENLQKLIEDLHFIYRIASRSNDCTELVNSFLLRSLLSG